MPIPDFWGEGGYEGRWILAGQVPDDEEIWITDQKVGGSSPSERAKQVRRSEPPTGSTNPFTWVDLWC